MAVAFGTLDRWLTVLNVGLPVIVLALSACNSIAKEVNLTSYISYSDIIIFITGILIFLSVYQATGDYRVGAIRHRHACCKFDAIALEIEATNFLISNDPMFYDIAKRLLTVTEESPHVPNLFWQSAR